LSSSNSIAVQVRGLTHAFGLGHSRACPVARRAERLMTALAQAAPVNPIAIKYINRLSDHLFVLARHLNAQGRKDVLWRPGANR